MSERIEDVEARYRQRLPALATKWRAFAEDVRDGYALAIDNYLNSLTIRDMLERAMLALGEADRRRLMELVEPSDTVFMRATRDDPERLLSRYPMHKAEWWWWNRVPIVLGTLAGPYGIYPFRDPRQSG